jgi:hypothetical protein
MEGYCREGQDYQSCSAIEEEVVIRVIRTGDSNL